MHSRRFIDIVHIYIPIPLQRTTYYKVGKLTFNLLPILLSRIKALGEPRQVYEVAVLLESLPAFHFIQNDPLELQKVKAIQAIEEFLKVRF